MTEAERSIILRIESFNFTGMIVLSRDASFFSAIRIKRSAVSPVNTGTDLIAIAITDLWL